MINFNQTKVEFIHLKEICLRRRLHGSCQTIRRVLASNTRDPGFESHQHNLLSILQKGERDRRSISLMLYNHHL